MSDLGDAYQAMREEKRAEQEPIRMKYARERLGKEGCELSPGPDDKSFTVDFPNNTRFHFWPYSGWFNRIGGPGNGRGIASLLKESRKGGKNGN